MELSRHLPIQRFHIARSSVRRIVNLYVNKVIGSMRIDSYHNCKICSFLDESISAFVSDNRGESVVMEPGIQERLAVAKEVVPSEGGSVIFWSGIIYGCPALLTPVPQTMAGNIYVENNLRAIVLPLRNEIGHRFTSMDVNATSTKQ
ncbi:hypothetical protein HHI36_000680 [Cryptolaemus montrouzieri]|uniref:Uncharacterized protein n=1 Tax=Cryptolaemus montrouzieri TaxID=559131 RepID=A0ABD2P593_9CUCU